MTVENPAEKPPVILLAETLLEVAVEQENAVLAALHSGLQMASHPNAPLRSDAEIEADQDNLPV